MKGKQAVLKAFGIVFKIEVEPISSQPPLNGTCELA